MAFNKKTWVGRITENPNKRKLTYTDGSTQIVTVARAEGTVTREGDALNEENMNDLEKRIDAAIEEVTSEIERLENYIGNDLLGGAS